MDGRLCGHLRDSRLERRGICAATDQGLTALACVLPAACIVSLFFGTGRTPYDRICGTVVTSAA